MSYAVGLHNSQISKQRQISFFSSACVWTMLLPVISYQQLIFVQTSSNMNFLFCFFLLHQGVIAWKMCLMLSKYQICIPSETNYTDLLCYFMNELQSRLAKYPQTRPAWKYWLLHWHHIVYFLDMLIVFSTELIMYFCTEISPTRYMKYKKT